jgi:hypothetical protein
MPPVSEAQRRLMFAAANKKSGAGGVPQSVGKEFTNADPGGKLPAHEDAKAKRRHVLYNHPRSGKK